MSPDERFQAEVNSQLARLSEYSNPAKRRETITKLAEAAAAGGSMADVFRLKGTISQRVYYDKAKDWHHDALFREVLDAVTRLTQDYITARELAEMEAARRAWRARMAKLADKTADRVESMLDFPLARRVSEDGKTVIEPASWSMGNVAPLLRAADATGRLALEMETEHIDHTTGGGKLPAVSDAIALLQAARQAAREGDGNE